MAKSMHRYAYNVSPRRVNKYDNTASSFTSPKHKAHYNLSLLPGGGWKKAGGILTLILKAEMLELTPRQIFHSCRADEAHA